MIVGVVGFLLVNSGASGSLDEEEEDFCEEFGISDDSVKAQLKETFSFSYSPLVLTQYINSGITRLPATPSVT